MTNHLLGPSPFKRTTPATNPLDPNLPSPGLPVPHPCLSVWQRTTRANPLINLNSSPETKVPDSADVVVIGSGLSGALTAYELLQQSQNKLNVVILEAREATSGPSGRNAGHCRPDAFRGFTAFSNLHGAEQAKKILEHEKLVLQLVDQFVKEKGVECDWDNGKTFDVVLGEEFKTYVEKSFEQYTSYIGAKEVSGVRVLSAEEAKQETHVPAALGAYEWNAANLHPAKLCLATLKMCLESGAQLFTHTPAVAITPACGSGWFVQTPKGKIRTAIVVHATNAFAATLIPGLKDLVVPTRAQAHLLIPPSQSLSSSSSNTTAFLTHTYSLRFALHHFYSLIQRKSDGYFVLGTSRGIPTMSPETRAEITGSKDDRVVSEEIQEDALGVFWKLFKGRLLGSSEEEEGVVGTGEGHQYGWTGILGMTKDSVPFIGKVPGAEGQWVMAGFNGHGMARIFGCAPGLAQMILGKGKWADTGMPECFEITEERLAKLSAAVDKPKL